MQRPSLNTEESLLVVDSDGIVTCISPACMNILHTRPDSVGQRLEDMLGKSSELVAACRELLSHPGEKYPDQLQFSLVDDTDSRLLARLYPMERGGRMVGVIITLRDLRQIRREEMRMRRAERLNMLARLSASLAHEIRNPLNAIVINLEVLKNTIEQLSPKSLEKAKSYIRILSDELERLNGVLDNFLGLAHPVEVVHFTVEVNQIVRDTLELMRHQAEQAGVEMHEDLSDSIIQIDGNADQLKQALLNLILNAIEAMPYGGQLSVITRKEADLGIIQIADTGIGIPEDIQDNIFDFYFTTKKDGMGLGLPIVARVVEFHRGGMDLESSEGAGTKFTLEFPLSEREETDLE